MPENGTCACKRQKMLIFITPTAQTPAVLDQPATPCLSGGVLLRRAHALSPRLVHHSRHMTLLLDCEQNVNTRKRLGVKMAQQGGCGPTETCLQPVLYLRKGDSIKPWLSTARNPDPHGSDSCRPGNDMMPQRRRLWKG